MSVRLGPFCSGSLLGDDRTRFILSERYKLALHRQQGPEVEAIIDFEQHFQQRTGTRLHQISQRNERKQKQDSKQSSLSCFVIVLLQTLSVNLSSGLHL